MLRIGNSIQDHSDGSIATIIAVCQETKKFDVIYTNFKDKQFSFNDGNYTSLGQSRSV